MMLNNGKFILWARSFFFGMMKKYKEKSFIWGLTNKTFLPYDLEFLYNG